LPKIFSLLWAIYLDGCAIEAYDSLVVGYGNTLRGDDGIGYRVAEAVAKWQLPQVRSIAVAQLLPELAADIGEVEIVMFVDAIVALDSSVGKHVNYPAPTANAVWCGLPNSRATASAAVDLRPYRFGLTLPPRAVTLVPNANIRKPSFFISIAALMSRSCRNWQQGQSNSRTDKSIFGSDNKVFEHR
jgi:hypothetical protein